MLSAKASFGQLFPSRAGALACAALLYFAAGGFSLFHTYEWADTAAIMCQSLHMPSLAAARLDLVSHAR